MNIHNETESNIKMNNQNDFVHIESIKVDNKVKQKKPPVKRALTTTVVVNRKIENFSLDGRGTIENARKHSSANRPLHKIRDFTEKTNFCFCCYLPCEEKGIIEPFHFCDNIDDFSECGLGITLYFYFIQFMTVILFLGICVLAISVMIFNNNYTDSIFDICDDLYNNKSGTIVETKNITYCKGFIKQSTEETNYYQRFNRWILRFSSDNIDAYRKIHKHINAYPEDNVEKVVVNYSILNFCYLITSFIINIYFIIFIKTQGQKARLLNITIKDYTVLISDAKKILEEYLKRPESTNPRIQRGSQIEIENGKAFKAFVNEYIKGHKQLNDLEINSINLCYELGPYMNYRKEYDECKGKLFQIENHPNCIELNEENNHKGNDRLYYNFCLSDFGMFCCHSSKESDNYGTLYKQKGDLEKQLDQEERDATQYITEKNFTGYMLVSFNTIEDKERFLEHYPPNFFGRVWYILTHLQFYLFCCCLSKEERTKFDRMKEIDAYDPPEPEDIYWENFNITGRQRALRTIGIFGLCLLIICVSLGCVFGLTLLQEILYANDEKQGTSNIFLKYLISLAITIVISVINAILQEVLERFTHKEKQISRSNYILSLSIKITIFTFLNSAIIPLLSKHIVILLKENDNEKGRDYYSRARERDNLVIDDMLIYFIVNAIVTPLLWTFSVPYFLKKLKQCCIKRRVKDDSDEVPYMTQKELNTLYEFPDMNIAYKLSYFAKTVAMCLFFMPIFPLGFVFAFVGFIFGYYLEKFNFTHLYKRPDMLDEVIAYFYADYFIIILFIGGIGDFFFLHDIYEHNRWALLNIILFGLLIIVPYTKFITCDCIGINKSIHWKYTLSEIFFTFYNDYQRQNPLTKRIGILNYLSELRRQKYLSDYAYKIAQANIEKLNIMEIYYGISTGNIHLAQQSIIATANNMSIISEGSIRNSIIGRGFLNSTIVRPEIADSEETKKLKRKMYDSQVINTFEGLNLKGKKSTFAPIKEEDQDYVELETKDNLVDDINNPINEGIGNLPLTTSVYKN